MSYTRDSARDLAWDESSQSYVPASVPPTEYTCDRDTTLDIYESALDPDTVYNVTDQQDSFINIIRDTIWPVGSLYLGMMEVCPLAALFGTWVKVSSGRVLQGADDNHLAGTAIEAGLPDITIVTKSQNPVQSSTAPAGTPLTGINGNYGIQTATNAYGLTGAVGINMGNTSIPAGTEFTTNNPIYGKSTTVQPPAFCVNIWQRIA